MANKGNWLPNPGDGGATGGFQTGTQNGNQRAADVYIVNPSSGPGSTTQTFRIDDVSKSLSYIGFAPIGSATSAAVWRIFRLQTTGDVQAQEWADGDSSYDNIWDDRATLTYS